MKTTQEIFWEGDFGDDYINRNSDKYRINNFSKILLNNRININNVIEFGANIGLNLDAIKLLLPECETFGIEINKKAFDKLSIKHESFLGSIYEYSNNKKYDLSFSSGVLIHQDPTKLNSFYEKLYESSNKYILLIEYFSPAPTEIKYRGHDEKLFKRDFAKELWSKYKNLQLIDYGFFWSMDEICNGDDTNWFLFQK